jgi:hypothetical protein
VNSGRRGGLYWNIFPTEETIPTGDKIRKKDRELTSRRNPESCYIPPRKGDF